LADEGTGEFPSTDDYVLWLPEEGIRYVAAPRRARAVTGSSEGEAPQADAAQEAERVREKVGIWMRRDIRRRLRIHAAVLDRDMSDVIEDAVTEYLDRRDAERAAEGLPPIPLR
jgi:hypothetical protein